MRKIDIFNHIMPRKFFDRLQKIAPNLMVLDYFRNLPALWDLDAHLRVMDQFEGYEQVISLSNPPIENLGGPDETPGYARMVNDLMAELVQKHPDRFPGFIASLPMNNPEASAQEANRAITELNACGVQIFSNVLGRPLSEPEYFQVFETVAEHDLPVWVHPMRMPNHPDYVTEEKSEDEIWFTFGWPYETTACMTRLIYSGIFDKLPGLKIITHHMGGMIPYFANKIDLGFSQVFKGEVSKNPIVEKTGLKKQPIEYYKMLYGDTSTNGSASAMRCGHDFFTTKNCVFGTDSPFDPLGGGHLIGGTIAAINTLEIPDAEKQMIFAGNAQRLLRLQ